MKLKNKKVKYLVSVFNLNTRKLAELITFNCKETAIRYIDIHKSRTYLKLKLKEIKL